MKKEYSGSLREMVVFSLFGGMMYLSAQIDIIPNVHQLALFISALTVVYRFKALIPIYLYIFLEGLFGGFSLWWYPYLYLWIILWLMIMLIPRNISTPLAAVLITVAGGIHGITFGTLYAPYQCIVYFNGNFDLMIPWIISGFPFDVMQMIGNVAASLVAIPLIKILCRLENKKYPYRE